MSAKIRISLRKLIYACIFGSGYRFMRWKRENLLGLTPVRSKRFYVPYYNRCLTNVFYEYICIVRHQRSALHRLLTVNQFLELSSFSWIFIILNSPLRKRNSLDLEAWKEDHVMKAYLCWYMYACANINIIGRIFFTEVWRSQSE